MNYLDGVVPVSVVLVVHVECREHLSDNFLVALLVLASEPLEHVPDSRDGGPCVFDRGGPLVYSLPHRPGVLLSLCGGFLHPREPVRERIPDSLDDLVPRQVRIPQRDDVPNAQLEHLPPWNWTPVNLRPVRGSHVGDVNLPILSSLELGVLPGDGADAQSHVGGRLSTDYHGVARARWQANLVLCQ